MGYSFLAARNISSLTLSTRVELPSGGEKAARVDNFRLVSKLIYKGLSSPEQKVGLPHSHKQDPPPDMPLSNT